MYGIIYIEEPINVGSTDLICPKAIHIIKADDDKSLLLRKIFEFRELDLSISIDEAYYNVLDNWREIFREMNNELSDTDNLLFLDIGQYKSFFHARAKSHGWMKIRNNFRIPQKYTKNVEFTSVGKSGAENVWNMFTLFKNIPNNKLERIKISKSKPTNVSKVLCKRAEVCFVNEHTGFITKQLESLCNKLDMEIREDNGIVEVFTITGDWKFNALARPTILSKRNYGHMDDDTYHVEKEGIYSPLEAIQFIRERSETELAEKLLNIHKLDLEDILNGSCDVV